LDLSQSTRVTDGQNYNSQDRASIAASCGKNMCHLAENIYMISFTAVTVYHNTKPVTALTSCHCCWFSRVQCTEVRSKHSMLMHDVPSSEPQTELT